MARPQATDFLASMRFHVSVVPAGDQSLDLRTGGDKPQAGFSNVTTPAVSVEATEYKEGQMVYTRKYPGNPTVEEVSMQRGAARGDSSFWDWVRVVIEGSGEYRATVEIKHYHRDTALTRPVGGTNDGINKTEIDLSKPARTYILYEAFPIRHKVAGDLDATSSEISLMELDVAYEHFEVLES